MAKFNLIRDERQSTWYRYYCEIEANTLEEAVEKLKDFDNDVEIIESEQLFDITAPILEYEIYNGNELIINKKI